jgi:ABC-type nickel/cobalt efflux system permease component RcnA
MTALGMLLLGFLLGMKHATEADHLAAVATLATRQSSVAQTVKQGVAWGIGHTVTLTVFGAVVLALGKTIPPALSQLLELGVGVMLILLGIDVLHRVRKSRIHFHVHSHDGGVRHLHAHSHATMTRDAGHTHASIPSVGLLHRHSPNSHLAHHPTPHRQSPHRHAHAEAGKLPLRALAIGVMHGLAGSAALILLSLEAVQSFPLGLAYILLFGAGSIAGMALLSVVIAIPLRFSAGSLARIHRGMTLFVGGFSCALGLFIVWQIGVSGGLFLA